MFSDYFVAWFAFLLIFQNLHRVFAIPVTTTVQSPLSSKNFTDNRYDIRLCNSTQHDSLGRAIDGALQQALNTWHDASKGRSLYVSFFKNRNYPVLDALSKVASYDAIPARGVDIFWACITPMTKTYFPRANSDLLMLARMARSMITPFDIVLQALVDYALPTRVERFGMDTLDEMVGANAYSSYLSPQNYQIYSISK
ncbi:MAG: hypothetical protein Q9223_005779 [Gallowayella weberi]